MWSEKQSGSGQGRNVERDFRGEKRKHDTRSSNDPDARLFRKAAGNEAKLCHMGHLMIENGNGPYACSSSARDSRCGGIDGRPWRAYSLAKSRQILQRRVGQVADRTQRVIRWNALLQRQVAVYAFRPLICPAHRVPQPNGIRHMHGITLRPTRKTTFSAAC
ncbi:hypothetical protein ABIB85_007392 [Bradyrhizobium sp. JR1.5]